MTSKNLWSALADLPVLAAVDSEWRLSTGDDYGMVRQFLRPLEKYADFVPCQNPRQCMCQHEAVELSNGEIIAVCQCEYYECDAFSITKTDLVIYDFNEQLLCRKLAEALKLDSISRQVDDMQGVYHLSDIKTVSGLKFPVFLVIGGLYANLEHTLLMLICTCKEPPIILHTCGRPLRPNCIAVAERTGSLLLNLADAVPVANGKFVPNELYSRSLETFLSHHAPSKDTKSSVFPTPPGTAWADISVHFMYTDQVEIIAPGRTRQFTCHELGMGSSRKKTPIVVWDFFYDIATNHGVIDYSIGNKDKNKDWKTQLSKHLRRIFGIEDDPFFYDDEGKIWNAKFKVSC